MRYLKVQVYVRYFSPERRESSAKIADNASPGWAPPGPWKVCLSYLIRYSKVKYIMETWGQCS